MLYNDFNSALMSKEKGYILKLKYERFMQINFSELNVSAILLSDDKDFEMTNTDGSLILTSNFGGTIVQSVEILVHQMRPEEYDIVELCGRKHMVIIKPLTEKITVDGLIFIKNRNTALAILSNFADVAPINVTIPFPEDTMKDFLEFVKLHGSLISKIGIGEMEYFNGDGMPVLTQGLYIDVKYDIFDILEREKIREKRNNSNKNVVDKKYETVEKIKKLGKDTNLISDNELVDILEDYAASTQDEEYYYDNNDDWNLYSKKYTRSEHNDAYEDLCKEISDHVKDGNVEFIYNPRHRHALTERLQELR